MESRLNGFLGRHRCLLGDLQAPNFSLCSFIDGRLLSLPGCCLLFYAVQSPAKHTHLWRLGCAMHTSMQSYAMSCYTRLCCVIHYLCNVMPNAEYHTLRIAQCARHCSVVPSTLCPMCSLQVLCIMRFTLCGLHYALCAMYYTLCPMLSRAMY